MYHTDNRVEMISTKFMFVLIELCSCFLFASSLKVLLIGSIHSSGHGLFFNRLINVLDRKLGHEVFMLSSRDSANTETVLAIPNPVNEKSVSVPMTFSRIISKITFAQDLSSDEINTEWKVAATAFEVACANIINDKSLTDWLRSIKPDVVLAYQFEMCYNVLITLGHIPPNVVGLNPGSFIFNQVAVPQGRFTAPSYIPSVTSHRSDRILTMRERAENSLDWWKIYLGDKLPWDPWNSQLLAFDRIFRKYGQADHRSIASAITSAPGIIFNSDVLIDFPRPLTHDMFLLGNTLFDQAQALNKSWENLMDNSKLGVIVCSFGTTIDMSSMPQQLVDILVEALSDPLLSDYTIIWKFTSNLTVPNNVHIVDWIPQMAVLKHPKVHLFITHTGYNSTPTLNMPLSLDQHINALRITRLTDALILQKNSITKGHIVNATLKLLKGKSDRRVKQASMMSSHVASSHEKLDVFLRNMASRRRIDWIQGDAIKTLTNIQSMTIDVIFLFIFNVCICVKVIK